MTATQEDMRCEHCGAPSREYKQGLTSGLIATLRRFGREIGHQQENRLHIPTEGGFTHNQLANFQKLRYWGLVERWTDADGGRKTGYWLLTGEGLAFLRGQAAIPRWVRTFRTEVVWRSEEMVRIDSFPDPTEPYWQRDFEYEIHGTAVVHSTTLPLNI